MTTDDLRDRVARILHRRFGPGPEKPDTLRAPYRLPEWQEPAEEVMTAVLDVADQVVRGAGPRGPEAGVPPANPRPL